MELYEEIVKEILPSMIFQNDVIASVKEKAERLNRLAFRSVIYGSSRVTGAILDLVEFYQAFEKIINPPVQHPGKAVNLTLVRHTEFCERILEFVREESGKYVVDKKIFKFFEEFKLRANKINKEYKHCQGSKNDKYKRDRY
jgi:hypothetical protein